MDSKVGISPVRRGIRVRILAIAWIPSLLLVASGIALSAVFALQGAQTKRFTGAFTVAAPPISALATTLMSERRASEMYLIDPEREHARLDELRQELDTQAPSVLQAARERAAASPQAYSQLVDDLSAAMSQLPAMRKKVDTRQVSLLQVSDFYSGAVASITQALYLIAAAEPVPKAALGLAAAVSLLRAADSYVEADGLALAATVGPGLSADEYTRYVELLGGARTLVQQTQPLLDPVERREFAVLRQGAPWRTLAVAHDAILLRGPATPATPATTDKPATGTAATGTGRKAAAAVPQQQAAELPDEQTWDGESLKILSGFGAIGTAVSVRAATISGDAAHAQLIRSLVLGIALLGTAAVVLLLTTRASGRMIARLGRLRQQTLELSHERLPRIIDQLRRGEQVDVEAEVSPLDLGRDEIGQVADAFNHAQRTAVAAAVREAEARVGLRAVFSNIAHRSQSIVHRQLRLLDQAERGQEDPDQLSLLFELDHLTTRARRNAENLIILGGGQAGRQWRNPVPLVQIVRSAISEARDYVRVSLGPLPQVAVTGASVADVIHLLAELVDNATSFSPPMSRVEVRGNLVGRGVVLEIEDQGLGMEPGQIERLNAMLHESPDFQVMALRDEPRLGIFVVAQLAARQDIRVTLTPSPAYGGTRVVVLIPSQLIDHTADAASSSPARTASAGTPSAGTPSAGTPSAEGATLRDPQPLRGTGALAAIPEPPHAWERPVEQLLAGWKASGAPPEDSAPAPRDRDRRGGDVDHNADHDAVPAGPPSGPAAPPVTSGPATPPASARPAIQHPPGTAPPAKDAPGPGPASPQGRPALPRRTRQSHLAPQLRVSPTPEARSPGRPVDAVDPEQARRRMAAFQAGTHRGREATRRPGEERSG